MNLTTLWAMYFAAATQEAPTPGDGPSGPPVTPTSTEVYGSPFKVRVRWTNGDPTAYTRVYATSVAAANLKVTRYPGDTAADTDLDGTVSGVLQLTHYKDGQESAALQVDYGATGEGGRGGGELF